MREYISTSVSRRFLSLLAASGLKLPETVNLNIDGTHREFLVLHRIELEGYPKQAGLIESIMNITSWAVEPNDGLAVDSAQTEVIDPELDWVKFGHFWVGKTERIYKDVTPMYDKKLAGFGWCGNAERELAFTKFCLLKNGPLFTTQVRLDVLEMFAQAQTTASQPAAVKIGAISEDGAFTPAGSDVILVSESVPQPRVGVEHLAQATQKSQPVDAIHPGSPVSRLLRAPGLLLGKKDSQPLTSA